MMARVSVIDDGVGFALAHDGEDDLGVGLAAHALYGVIERHAFHRRFVELDDQVAGLDPGPRCRRIVDRRDHAHKTVFHADFDAETAELALGADLHFLEGFLVKIGRMRIEPGQHAVDGFSDQLLVFDRFNVVALDASEHFGERAQLFDRQRQRRGFALCDGRVIEADRDANQDAGDDQAELIESAAHLMLLPRLAANVT